MKQQKDLVETYLRGWKEKNLDLFLSTLSPDCLIIESHGPSYQGKDIIKQWFLEWHQGGHQVEKWDLISFYLAGNMVFCEWNFTYSGPKLKETFEGISLVQIHDDKICYLKEYRSIGRTFQWTPNKTLNPL